MRRTVVLLFFAVACRRPVPVAATVTPARAGVVKVDVVTEAGAKVTLRTTPSMESTAGNDGHAAFEVATTSYPLGSVSIDIDVVDTKKPGRHGEAKATFDRGRIAPVATIVLDPRRFQSGCHGDSCRHYFGKDLGPSRVYFDAPLGTTVEIGGVTTHLIADDTSASVDLATPFAALAATLVVGKPDSQARMPPMRVPMKITSPDGDRADGEATFDVASELEKLAKALGAIQDAGVALLGDSPAPARLRVIYDAEKKQMFGKGSIGEIDAVAFRSSQSHNVGTCGLYQSDSGKTVAVSNYAVDVDVIVRDRQTSKEIARKRFFGSGSSCPDTAHMWGGSASLTGNQPDDKLIDGWLTTLAHGTNDVDDGSLRKLSPR